MHTSRSKANRHGSLLIPSQMCREVYLHNNFKVVEGDELLIVILALDITLKEIFPNC